MKKIFAIIAMFGLLSLGMTQTAMAQDETAAPADQETVATTDSAAVAEAPAVEEVAPVVAEEESQSFHKALKVKFIEGGAGFMSSIAIAFIIGLAFCIERIIYLSLAEVNTDKMLKEVEAALEKGDLEGAKKVCRNTRGPVASICYQGLMRVNDGLDVVERSVVSYGGVQASALEKNCSWVTLFIAIAPSLGFLGTVVGMVMAFDDIQKAGDISPTIVAAGMKVALITTIFGIIVALVLQVFYNFILTKIEAINGEMEDSSITLLDLIMKYNLKYNK
jgi:biopolymer transport protein ExbB